MSVLNFKKGKIEVKNQGDRIKLIIYGEIVSTELDKWIDEDVAPKDIQDILHQIGDKDLDIYINSVGGSVFAGMAIYNMLKRHKGYKTVYVDGVAASIASVIAMVGDKIYIPKNSFLMVHKAWCEATGNSDDLIKLSETLEVLDEGILNVYKTKLLSEKHLETIKDFISNETWLSGENAQKYFDIEVTEAIEIAASFDSSYCNKHNVPQELKSKLKNGTLNKDKNNLNLEKAKLKLQLLI
jgi:ATP-dependent protease ClpP protease subunit